MSENTAPATTTYPVVPLRNAVLFPGVAFPIAAGRSGTLRSIETALRKPQNLVFAVTQREDTEAVGPEGLYTIGTIAQVTNVQRGPGGMRLVLNGQQRGITMRLTDKNGMLEAAVVPAQEMAALDPNDPAFKGLYKELRERAAELGKKLGFPDEGIDQFLREAEEPGRLADLVAGYIDIPASERQVLLETLSVEERLRRTLVHVQRQITVLAAQEDIKSKVQSEISDRQREMYLREQMKAIQKELGEDGGDDESLEELKKKLDGLPLPEEARREVDREWKRLQRLSKDGMEAQVVRTYLENVAELPWGIRSEEKLDVAEAAKVLDEDHYGLADVKDRVLEFLAVLQMRRLKAEAEKAEAAAAALTASEAGDGAAKDGDPKTPADAKREAAPNKGRILLFAGPPGVGKTSIAKSIARAMGRKYVRISLGGARDEADVRGHRRTYVGAMPGRIIAGMKQAGTKNPVFLLDEIDKLGVSYQGDPAAALLEVLDPAQNDSFTDHYLGIPFDLSEVLFVATANFLQNIPGPLQDRMEVVSFSGYTEAEKLGIARTYLLPRQLRDNGLSSDQLTLEDSAVAAVITGYTREAGVRQLERELGRLARKVARKIAAGETTAVTLAAGDVGSLLGKPKVHPEKMIRADEVGVSTGMYYTPVGGDIMFVEAALMRGKGEVILTGQLGDVMKESARAAWTFARSHAAMLGIAEDSFERDLHVHVPAGAIPKDGPSAGIAMASALVSALSKRPVRHDLAMTGEITLSGRVLPIGGVKEKVLGAVRAGIRTVVLPKENEADLDDLPKDVLEMLTVHAVSDLGEALAITLRGASFQNGQLLFGVPAAAPRVADGPEIH
ncbi:MAG: endopeptidase La [Acidobacteria bacterium]|nr:endopeptidase La [Acidobacteriota bacterium]